MWNPSVRAKYLRPRSERNAGKQRTINQLLPLQSRATPRNKKRKESEGEILVNFSLSGLFFSDLDLCLE
jgi:hypothetical protein